MLLTQRLLLSTVDFSKPQRTTKAIGVLPFILKGGVGLKSQTACNWCCVTKLFIQQ